MDWNNDGRKDLVVGESYDNGQVQIYLNQGSDANPVFNGYSFLQVAGANFAVVNQATPEIVDWNNDGRKDVLCGCVYGEIYLLLNTGSDAAPSFAGATFVQDGAGNLDVGSRSCPAAADWNRDGKKDLLVGAADGCVYYFENKGTDASPVFNGSAQLPADGTPIAVGSYARPEVADFNGDGLKDLLVGCDSGQVWYYEALNTNYPYFRLADFLVNDSSGNTNGVLNPGETAQITVRLTNSAAAASHVTATLTSASPYLTIIAPCSAFGDVGHGRTAMNSQIPFGVSIAGNAPQDSFYSFHLDVSSQGCSRTNRCAFVVGEYALTAPATFAWLDASGGSNLRLTDEGIARVNLHFAFPFYGQSWTQIYACANGYLTLGSPDSEYENSPIPSSGSPSPVIAPFWDDLDPTSTGSVRCQWGGSAPNRYLVVEWSQVPRFETGGQLTFEAILYETGKIKFQYGPLSGSYSDGGSATIGVESYEGVAGLQYSCNLPGAVQNGLAIEISLGRTAVDSNGDGVPDSMQQFYFPGTNISGHADSDGDGLCNWMEIRAGTDPAEARSVLALQSLRLPTAMQAAFQWQSVPGKPYFIQMATSLVSRSWTPLNVTPIYGDANGMNSYTASTFRANGGFYRVAVP